MIALRFVHRSRSAQLNRVVLRAQSTQSVQSTPQGEGPIAEDGRHEVQVDHTSGETPL